VSFSPAAEENGLLATRRRAAARQVLERVRAYVVERVYTGNRAAEGMIRARGEPFYRVARSGAAYVLNVG
jgi:hypothetical protein